MQEGGGFREFIESIPKMSYRLYDHTCSLGTLLGVATVSCLQCVWLSFNYYEYI